MITTEALTEKVIKRRLSMDAASSIAHRAGYAEGLLEGHIKAICDTAPEHLRSEIESAMRAAKNVRLARKAGMKVLRSRRRELQEKIADLEAETAQIQRHKDGMEEVIGWLQKIETSKDFSLGAVTESALHKVFEEGVLMQHDDPVPADLELAKSGDAMVFLIQHDWTAPLATADVDEGECRLPADLCCFEMTISGRRTCFLVSCEDGIPVSCSRVIRTTFGWCYDGPSSVSLGRARDVGLSAILMEHVRAISIMLDADVMRHDVVRAPYRLNAAREKSGKMPIYDHHVLSLSKRARAERLPDFSDGPRRKVRFHFRRGHWRHYETHKTWIKWMMVGEPAMGFSDKDYAL